MIQGKRQYLLSCIFPRNLSVRRRVQQSNQGAPCPKRVLPRVYFQGVLECEKDHVEG